MNIPHRKAVSAAIFGLMLGTGCAVGYSASRYGSIQVSDPLCWVFFSVFLIAGCCGVYLYLTLSRAGLQSAAGTPAAARPSADTPADNPDATSSVYGRIYVMWPALMLLWMPVFLAVFPGFFVYDATDEYVEVATRVFSTHHPLLHTLALGGMVRAGEVFLGSANVGIAAYILIQMLLLSLLFAWLITTMRRMRLFAFLWYGLFPTVVMFALCSVKDTMCAAGILLCVVSSVRMIRRFDVRDLTAALIAGLCVMLMRNNGAYAYVMYACVMIAFFIFGKRKTPVRQRLCGPAFLIPVILYMIISPLLTYATHASDHEHQEALCVPIQQLARTWSVYEDEFDADDLETLYRYLPADSLVHYTPELADPVKSGFRNDAYEEAPDGFWRVWRSQLALHPMSYINAWIDTSYGLYYPFTIVNVYKGHTVTTYTYTESSYFGYETELPGERHSIIPAIDGFYRWLSRDDDIQRIPVISLLFSMGAMFWFYAFAMVVLAYRKRYDVLVPCMLPGLMWATFLAGPTFLPRYTVFWWFMFPYMIYEVFYETSFVQSAGD